MRNRFFSFTLIPHTPKGIRHCKIPFPLLFFFIGLFLSISIALSLFIHRNFYATVESSEISLQEQKTALLLEKIRGYENEIKEVKEGIERLDDLSARMEELSPHQRMKGIERQPEVRIEAAQSADLNLEGIRRNLSLFLQEVKSQEEAFHDILTTLQEDPRLPHHLPSIQPARGWTISGYGDRENPFTGRTEMHKGIDIANLLGTPILATADGIVRSTGYRLDLGFFLILDHGYSLTTFYGHCSKLKVKAGNRVKRGQVIALMGRSGRTLGPHLHYEVRVKDVPVDPLSFVLETI